MHISFHTFDLTLFRTLKYREVLLCIVAIAILAALTLIVHGSALEGSWRFDDGLHMKFATQHSPLQYFFTPEITRLQSGINVTPWNVLSYDINLNLFGLNSFAAYAHQIFSLWLISVATFILLRFFTRIEWALFGGILFIVGTPTVHIAQELMTSHYAAGLLFTILALHCFIHALEKSKICLSLLGSFFYLMATSCKEIYVPLILILPFIPVGFKKNRVIYSTPYFFILIFYFFWRDAVLGSLQGGRELSFDPFSYSSYTSVINTFMQLPVRFFDQSIIINMILISVAILILIYLYKNPSKLPLCFLGLLLSLGPLLPVAEVLNQPAQGRLLFFPWWVFAIFLTLIFSVYFNNDLKLLKYMSVFMATSIFALATQAGSRELSAISSVLDAHDKTSKFVLSSDSSQIIYDKSSLWYPTASVIHNLITVEKSIYPNRPKRAKVLMDPYQLSSLDYSKTSVWSYDTECKCITNITNLLLKNTNPEFVEAGATHPLTVSLMSTGKGLEWKFGPGPKDSYAISTADGHLYFPVPAEGRVDRAQVFLEHFQSIYIYRTTSDGVTTRSALLHFNTNLGSVIEWSR